MYVVRLKSSKDTFKHKVFALGSDAIKYAKGDALQEFDGEVASVEVHEVADAGNAWQAIEMVLRGNSKIVRLENDPLSQEEQKRQELREGARGWAELGLNVNDPRYERPTEFISASQWRARRKKKD